MVGITTGGVALAIVQGGDWGWTSAPVLVAILGSTASGDLDLDGFRRAFIYLGTVAVLASLVATRLPAPALSEN